MQWMAFSPTPRNEIEKQRKHTNQPKHKKEARVLLKKGRMQEKNRLAIKEQQTGGIQKKGPKPEKPETHNKKANPHGKGPQTRKKSQGYETDAEGSYPSPGALCFLVFLI